jgi:homoserine O-acetyltransferase
VLLSTSTIFNIQDFSLEKGDKLNNLEIAYETYGTLNKDGNNGVLLCHGYTNNQHAAGDDHGWYSGVVGPGKAVDTNHYYVISANMLGSTYGSTGPSSINSARGMPYGLDFPDITIGDMVNSQIRLLDHLGVTQLVTVIGNSFGGHLAFQWGISYSERIRSIISVVSAPNGNENQSSVDLLLDRFSKCPRWNTGQYYNNKSDACIFDKLVKYRIETLKNYGCYNKIREDFGDDLNIINKHLTNLAKSWAEQFDANSLIVLRKASIQFDIRPMISRIKVPLLYVLSRTDKIFPTSIAKKSMEMFKHSGINAYYFEIDSNNGHRAPSVDWHKWEDELKKFIEQQSIFALKA